MPWPGPYDCSPETLKMMAKIFATKEKDPNLPPLKIWEFLLIVLYMILIAFSGAIAFILFGATLNWIAH